MLSTKKVTEVMRIHVASRVLDLLSAKMTAEMNLLISPASITLQCFAILSLLEAKQRKSIHVKGPAGIIKTGIPRAHRGHLSWHGNLLVCMQ